MTDRDAPAAASVESDAGDAAGPARTGLSRSPEGSWRAAASGGEDGPANRPDRQRKFERLLEAAASLMARQGYEQTSIRDVARETGFSLAGMYYYFSSKEQLLFEIQKRTFESLVAAQRQAQRPGGSPAERLARVVHTHLAFATQHHAEMKVCAFELESLRGDLYREVEQIRTEYYKLCASLVAPVLGRTGETARTDLRVRHATLFLFGMLNWVFTWFAPDRDGPPEQVADEMVSLLLRGLPAMGKTED